MSRTRNQLIRDIASSLGVLAGTEVETYNLNSYELLESILISIQNLNIESGGQSSFRPKIDTKTLRANLELTAFSAEIHNLETDIDRQIILPADPKLGLDFGIINQIDSTGNLLINGKQIEPGETHEIVFDGANWVVY